MSILFSENLINESIFIKVLSYTLHKIFIGLAKKKYGYQFKNTEQIDY